ncbi:adenylate kinase family protein [Patescibacteria group bacterium]
MNDKKVIFLIGPPGAGKDTQLNLLAEKTGFYKFVTGDEGLKYIEEHLDDAETAQQKVNYDKGELYEPEWLLNKVQKGRTIELLESGEKGIIFSGSPRTLYEAERLPKILGEIVGAENVVTVVMEISEEELKRRAGERLVCSVDENHTFSKRFEEIEVGDKCPEGDGILQKKGLDGEKEVAVRIQQYNDRTMPGINYLKEHGSTVTINGEQSVEDVHKEIIKSLDL